MTHIATWTHTERTRSRWGLWGAGTAMLVLLCAAVLGGQVDVEALRRVVRVTARTSLACFLMAYMASTGARLWPGAITQAWLTQRRQWGLLFVSSHVLHAAGIAALAVLASPELFAQLTPLPSRVIGGLGYVAVLALALTSSDRAVVWLGRARWQRLHSVGTQLIWLVFLLSMLKRAPASSLHAALAVLLVACAALKAWVAVRARGR